MLTIKNLNKLNQKTLGKKNFYVARIEERFDAYATNMLAINHKYIFELSNRKYAITVILDRTPVVNEQNYYKLYVAGSSIPMYLTIGEIKNMDKFLDKIRLVGLG